MKCKCGGNLTVTRTENTADRTVKRVRKCDVCSNKYTSYERLATDAPNQHENRLINEFRGFTPEQRESLWAYLRTFRQKEET